MNTRFFNVSPSPSSNRSGFKKSLAHMILGLTTLSALLVACQPRQSDPGPAGAGGPVAGVPAGYATTPQPCNLGQPNCNANIQAQAFGFPGAFPGMIFPMQANLNALNCGCPTGYNPLMNQWNQGMTWGLACGSFPNFQFQQANPWMWNQFYGYSSFTIGNVTSPQLAYPGSGNLCGGSIVYRYCTLGVAGGANGCPSGVCAPLPGGGPASGIGYCL